MERRAEWKIKRLIYINLSSVFSDILYQILDMSSHGIRNRMLPIPAPALSKEGLINFNPQEGPVIFKDSTESHTGLDIYWKGRGIEPNAKPSFT
jgi:hypothetical protein